MGSVYVYEGVDPERFKPLVSDGIGERRNEGFGRLAVNLNDDDSFSAHKCKPDLEIERGQLSFVGKKLAQDMATRRLKAAARNSVATYVSGTNFSKGRPTNAQLNCLRQLVQQAQARHEEKLDLISNHLDNLKKKAREQFDRYTLAPKGKGNPTWMEWLRERAANMDGLAQIGLSNTDPKLCVAGQLPRVDSTLSLQITCQLMDAILRKATKHKEQA